MTDEDLTGGFNETGDENAVVENDAEAKAREMGWKPEDEWVGDKQGWMPAEDFIARNERLKSRGDDILKADNAKLRSELADLKKDLTGVRDWMTQVEKSAYDRAVADIERRQRQAVKEGDEKAFDAAAKDARALQESVTKRAQEKPATPDEIPAFKDWIADNGWYRSDKVMRGYANEISVELAPQYGGPQAQNNPAFYEAVSKAVREQFPAKFRPAASTVEGATGSSGKPKGRTYDNLPADYKRACDAMVKRLGITREDYLKGVPEDAWN